MNAGDFINVYRDPFSRQNFEGHAQLIKKISEDSYFEWWEVKFNGRERTTSRKLMKPECFAHPSAPALPKQEY
jgi:hypothetical protein